MYDELTGNLRAQATHFSVHDETSLLLLKAADAIEELSKLSWISVEERLPEEGEFVLIYGDLYPNKHDGGVMSVSARFDWNYWRGFGRERNITHWMPLPEQPEEREA